MKTIYKKATLKDWVFIIILFSSIFIIFINQ